MMTLVYDEHNITGQEKMDDEEKERHSSRHSASNLSPRTTYLSFSWHGRQEDRNDECFLVWDRLSLSLLDLLSFSIPVPSHQFWNECQWNQWIHEWISTAKSEYMRFFLHSRKERSNLLFFLRSRRIPFEFLCILLSCVCLFIHDEFLSVDLLSFLCRSWLDLGLCHDRRRLQEELSTLLD